MVEPDAATFRTELAELEGRLDCAAWSRRVPPTVAPPRAAAATHEQFATLRTLLPARSSLTRCRSCCPSAALQRRASWSTACGGGWCVKVEMGREARTLGSHSGRGAAAQLHAAGPARTRGKPAGWHRHPPGPPHISPYLPISPADFDRHPPGPPHISPPRGFDRHTRPDQ